MLDYQPYQSPLYLFLKQEFGSELLNKKQTSKVLNISVATLDRQRKEGLGVGYKKIPSANGKGHTIRYPLVEIVKYIDQGNIATFKQIGND